MDCHELVRIINQYVDEEIDPSVCEQFEAHMADCHPCQVVVDSLRKTIKLYQDEREVELPAAFRERLQATLRAKWAVGKAGGSASADDAGGSQG